MCDSLAQLTNALPEDVSGHPAARVVLAYLGAMEDRQLERAKGLLAPGFVMTFPGPVQLNSLEALVEWASTRYRRIAKRYDGVDVMSMDSTGNDEHASRTIVYCFGTLYGEWNSGELFEGIRFIDRFEVANGLLLDQKVWNDLGEGVLRALHGR